MTSYVPAKKNTQLIFYIGLPDATDPRRMKSNPTIAAGDFKVSGDGGTLNNLSTLPTVSPASSKMVKITLSTSEMNVDNATLVCSDQTDPPEWSDVLINIPTAVRQIDDLAYPATSGRSLAVDANGSVDSNLVRILGTLLTESVGGYLAAGFRTLLNVASPVFTLASVNQTGDAYSRLGAPAGASVSADVAAINAKTTNLPASPAAVGSAMTLTSGERTAIANEVEAQIIDETDSEKVLTAITDKIASVNPDLGDLTLAAIGSAVRTELTTELAHLDADISSRLASGSYTAPDNSGIAAIKAKTDNLPASPAATGDIPTAAISAIKSKTDELAFTEAGVVDANIKRVNDAAVTGTGQTGDEWGPA